MSTDTGDLVTWLRERLDEDERIALAADEAESDVFDGTGIVVMHAATGTRSVTLRSDVARFTARFDPARVLTEVAAKRHLLDAIFSMAYRIDQEYCCHTEEEIAAGACPEPDDEFMDALKALAQPYSNLPGWRDEWKVTE